MLRNSLFLAFLLLGSCGGSSESLCVPGQQYECACSGDETGFQTCDASGEAFSECDCGPSGTGGSGNTTNAGAAGTGGSPVGGAPNGGAPGFGGALGSGGGGFCIFNPDDPCDPSVELECLCIGCIDSCVDGDGFQVSDCVCAACSTDEVCQTNCTNDGNCEPAREGCSCTDCANHPECG